LASDRPRLPLEAVAEVTAVWRRALLSRADQPVAEAISGHAPGSTPDSPRPSARPHLALLPLADVGHRLAGSDLVGMAAALPRCLQPEERTACLVALERVRSLTLGRLGEWRLERADGHDGLQALDPRSWSSPARAWASVTPVVLGRYPRKPWGEEAQQIVREACTIAGLPEPHEVETAPVGWVLGVPPASRFPPLAVRAGKPRRFHVHVRLVFAEPVGGPVLVGAGRHQGYGLFEGSMDEHQ
jgi:CRISPR-associated protein Csb2